MHSPYIKLSSILITICILLSGCGSALEDIEIDLSSRHSSNAYVSPEDVPTVTYNNQNSSTTSEHSGNTTEPSSNIVYIEIYTPSDLKQIERDMNGNYILMNDIDLVNSTWDPLGRSDSDVFTGILDGNGHCIRNLNVDINADNGNSCAGLFANLHGAVIMNLGINGGTISARSSYDDVYCGAFAGTAGQGTKFINCFNTAKVTATVIESGEYSHDAGSNVGGFIGYGSASFQNCYNTGEVSSALNAYADCCVGGFIGRVSGLGDYNPVEVKNCYNAGTINFKYLMDGNKPGGIIGAPYLSDSSAKYISMESVFYFNQVNPENLNSHKSNCALQNVKDESFSNVAALALEDLTTKENYTGFDFDSIWTISPDINFGLPTLRIFD